MRQIPDIRALFALSLAAAAGCTTIDERVAGACDVRAVAQAAADFYVNDGGDDTCVVGVARGADENVYSNMGFGLLGMTLEDALGKDLESIVSDELCVPLGLGDTTYTPHGAQTNRLTRACAGHLPWFVMRRHEVRDHRLGDALRATGGLFSSAADCIALFRACWLLLESYMKDHPLDSYGEDAVYGLLRVHVMHDGRRILYRSGMIYGGASFVGYDPESRTVVVILRNVTSWPDRRGFVVMERLCSL